MLDIQADMRFCWLYKQNFVCDEAMFVNNVIICDIFEPILLNVYELLL